MHNEAFAKLGLDYCYMCYEVNHENLEKTVEMCIRDRFILLA